MQPSVSRVLGQVKFGIVGKSGDIEAFFEVFMEFISSALRGPNVDNWFFLRFQFSRAANLAKFGKKPRNKFYKPMSDQLTVRLVCGFKLEWR